MHTCCYWEIPYITFPGEQIIHMPFYYIQDVYHKNQLETQVKRKSIASIKRAGGSEPFRRGFRGQSPLRRFLGSKEYLDWLKNTGKTLLYSIQYKNLLKYKLGCSWPLPIFTQSINFYVLYCHIDKEYRCLKNVIHQLEKNGWLLLSAFQQGLWQNWLLS